MENLHYKICVFQRPIEHVIRDTQTPEIKPVCARLLLFKNHPPPPPPPRNTNAKGGNLRQIFLLKSGIQIKRHLKLDWHVHRMLIRMNIKS